MAPVITAKENTCLIRFHFIISSELHLRRSNEEPLNEGISERPDVLQEGMETEESGFDFGYAYRVFDNEDILLELDGSNNITARYTHGPGIDEPLVMEKGGASFFYHADGLGSITEITDSTGALKQQYTYSSFGKIESQLDPTFIQPYTFTSREFDPETGLYFYRTRTLDPNTGTFLSQDRIGFLGGINFYSYVGNNPINFIDPLGLCACQRKTFSERVRDNFVETNKGVNEALSVPVAVSLTFARNLITSSATARALNLITPLKFALSGFKPLPTGIAPGFGASPFFSRPATAILAGTSGLINAGLNFLAFEVGIGIGSVINAGFLEDECGRSIFFGGG